MPNKSIAYVAAGLLFFSLLGLLYYSGLGDRQFFRLAAFAVIAGGGLAFFALDRFGVLCLTLAFLPFNEGAFKFEIGIITFSPFTMGTILLGFSALGLVLTGRVRFRRERFDVALAAVCAFYLVSLLSFPNSLATGGYLLSFHVLFIPSLCYFMLRVFLTTREQLETAFSFFIWGIGVFCLASLGRALASTERAIFLAVPAVSVATLAVAPLLYTLLSGRRRGPRGLLLAFSSAMTLFLSFSRGYLFLLLLSPYLLRAFRRGKAFRVGMAMFVATLFLSIGLAMSVPETTLKSFKEYSNVVGIDQEYMMQEKGPERLVSPSHWMKTMALRALLYRMGLDNFLSSPLVGIGIHMGKINVTQHNFHVEWLEFGGVVGYLLTVLMFLAYFGRMAGPARDDRVLACDVLLVFFILMNALTNGFMHGFFPHVAFIAIGFSFARLRLAEEEIPARKAAA